MSWGADSALTGPPPVRAKGDRSAWQRATPRHHLGGRDGRGRARGHRTEGAGISRTTDAGLCRSPGPRARVHAHRGDVARRLRQVASQVAGRTDPARESIIVSPAIRQRGNTAPAGARPPPQPGAASHQERHLAVQSRGDTTPCGPLRSRLGQLALVESEAGRREAAAHPIERAMSAPQPALVVTARPSFARPSPCSSPSVATAALVVAERARPRAPRVRVAGAPPRNTSGGPTNAR